MSPSNKKQTKSKLAKHATVTSSSPPLSADPPFTGVDNTASFATFISLADLSDIKSFFEAAGSSQESVNLKVFWGRAFAEGRKAAKAGQEEEYNRGFNAGYNEGYSEACEKDYDAGLAADAIVSTTEIGTQTDVDAPIRYSMLHSDASTQTSANFVPPHVDASIQAAEPSPPVISPQKMSPPRLNWADDANSLPITPLPPLLHQPRDLSVLRSLSSSSPFSSLQHRSKRFNHYSRQPRHHSHCHSNLNSSNSPRRSSFKLFQSYSHTKTHSHLNWESDPRLSDLSRSLKALGWIRAH
jgi:hypothetical protein